ncbi:RNA-directed DNA polymerase from mobile element jockey [Cyphomyrmex costatus]|uniref:RNA-directed DNA polymerase from mobile element jockey n=1 Tax=Cyphomyrmex costatus TaxID=456900 RepID=A0A151I7G2_9HYME|nr:RNA-directed DNA polymerase from mobile element jockey [Cyphomyrmex costatus]
MSKFNELSKYSADFNIILISETWLSPDISFKLRGFDTVREDRLGRGGGVLIAIRNDIKYRRIQVLERCGGLVEACAVEVSVRGEPLTVVSCYRPPNAGHIAVGEWDRFLSQFRGKVIFGGDFNSHNTVWGSASTCRIASDSLALILNWQVGLDPWGSDHLPITIEAQAGLGRCRGVGGTRRLHARDTDWNAFRDDMDHSLKLISDPDSMDPEVMYSTFVSIIGEAISVATPSKRSDTRAGSGKHSQGLPPPPSCPWWTAECDDWIRIRKEALSKFKQSGKREDFIEYKKSVAVTRKELRRIKQEKFRSFCEGLNKDSNLTYVWRTMKRFQSRYNQSEVAHECSPDKEKKICDQIDELRAGWVPVDMPPFVGEDADGFLDLPFSEDELRVAFHNLRVKSSPGLDGIDYTVIKQLSAMGRCFFLRICNSILSQGIFPADWRKYLITFIPKADGQKFRPISLAPCLCKVMERMLCNRLNWWLESGNKLPKS